ncbi:MAG: energy transducer TonB, partial [Candidatus Eisenbacteria bacterium]
PTLALILGASGLALLATSARVTGPPAALRDSLQACEGIMAHRVLYDSTGVDSVVLFPPERVARSSAVEGELKDHWIRALTSDETRAGADCTPVCLRCAERVRYRLYFPPLSQSFFANVLWDDHRVDVVSHGAVIAHRRLAAGDSAFAGLLRATFPSDSVTQALAPSDPRPRPPRQTLSPNEQVFVDRIPMVTAYRVPRVPNRAREQGIEGTVWVMALVNANGRVVDAFVKESVPALDEAAVETVLHYEFSAARCGGKRVAMWVEVPVRFSAKH